jgi:hypothetical protein
MLMATTGTTECNSCWFQELLPPPLGFRYPPFASSKTSAAWLTRALNGIYNRAGDTASRRA